MADIKIAYSTEQTITISLNSLANGSDVLSNAIDNSSNLWKSAIIHGQIDGNSASNTDYCEFYLAGSPDNTDYDTDEGDQLIGLVGMNGTTLVKFTISLERMGILYLPKYWKIRCKNASGDSLASSGNVMSFMGVYFTN